MLWVDADPDLATRIAFEFVSQMQDGEPPPDWRTTWPEIMRIDKMGRIGAGGPEEPPATTPPPSLIVTSTTARGAAAGLAISRVAFLAVWGAVAVVIAGAADVAGDGIQHMPQRTVIVVRGVWTSGPHAASAWAAVTVVDISHGRRDAQRKEHRG